MAMLKQVAETHPHFRIDIVDTSAAVVSEQRYTEVFMNVTTKNQRPMGCLSGWLGRR